MGKTAVSPTPYLSTPLSTIMLLMSETISGDLLQTKLYVPRLRPSLVPRPHFINKLNAHNRYEAIAKAKQLKLL